jgi:hypothetical protein
MSSLAVVTCLLFYWVVLQLLLVELQLCSSYQGLLLISKEASVSAVAEALPFLKPNYYPFTLPPQL